MQRLLKALESKRIEEKLPVTAQASRLGISDTLMVLIIQGKRSPGVKFLRAVAQLYPDLRPLVAKFVNGDEKDGVA